MKRCKVLLCLLAVLLCLSPLQVGAAEVIDLQRDVSLTLTCEQEGTVLSGESFRLYLIATVDAYGELTATEECQALHVDVDIRGKNDEAWRDLAATLENYASSLTPADSGKTDSTGTLRFPTGEGKLSQGLYLVMSDRHTQGGYYYDTTAFLVLLPALDSEKNQWSYDVTAAPKHDSTSIPDDDDTPSTVKRKVLKVWADEGREGQRPAGIVVHLLRDGKVYDSVILNEKNNWRYEWKSLSGSSRWTLTEDVPTGYTVNIDREGVTFVVTNTINPTTPTPTPTPTPSPGSTPAPSPSGTPTPSDTPAPTSSGTPVSSDSPTPTPSGTSDQPGGQSDAATLPQTGQLWWPVPILLCVGLFCVTFGLLRRRGDDRER